MNLGACRRTGRVNGYSITKVACMANLNLGGRGRSKPKLADGDSRNRVWGVERAWHNKVGPKLLFD